MNFGGQVKMAPTYAAVPQFWMCRAPPPRTNSHIARPHKWILKIPQSIFCSACGLGDHARKDNSAHLQRSPINIAGKWPFLPNSGRFPAILLGIRCKPAELSFICRIPQATCRTRDLLRDLSKIIRGAKLRGNLYGAAAP